MFVCYDYVVGHENNKAWVNLQNISHVSMCFHDPRDNEQNKKKMGRKIQTELQLMNLLEHWKYTDNFDQYKKKKEIFFYYDWYAYSVNWHQMATVQLECVAL